MYTKYSAYKIVTQEQRDKLPRHAKVITQQELDILKELEIPRKIDYMGREVKDGKGIS